MKWFEIFVETKETEAVFGLLYDMGITGAVIKGMDGFSDYVAWGEGFDYIDVVLLDSKNKEIPGVVFYIEGNADGEKQLYNIKAELENFSRNNGFEIKISIGSVKDEDWSQTWKQYFKPKEIGERLIVKPSWEEVLNPGGKIIMNIDPGSVFGTGSHETTALCLMLAEKYVQKGDRVLDIGCGSGILFLCALLLGASYADGIDIEEASREVAAANAAANGIDKEKFSVYCGNMLEDASFADKFKAGYDMVISNIVADIVIALSGIVPGCIKKGGIYISSGIINERTPDVKAALLKNGFDIKDVVSNGEWTAVSSVFKGE
ncbi:MAG: 50S ribosomal protein L11 methyltransferase [Lachnospiraceae bacterium]|nr:50S ribosomal protein L11 methyltransferase [Lachnospiraceae bacterium]